MPDMAEGRKFERTSAGTPRRTLLICLLLALAIAAVYWPVLKFGFINYDDPDYVSSNPRVQSGLTLENLAWAGQSFHASNWHPLTWLSHMLDCQLYGLKPWGHHLTSVLLHLANTLLLFGLWQRLTGAGWRSALVAALFALHPLHVESVAWIAERKDVLSAFFFLLTLWAYARYAGRREPAGEENRKPGARPSAPAREAHDPGGGPLPPSSPSARGEPAPPAEAGAVPGGKARASAETARRFPAAPRGAKWFYLLALLCFALGLMSKPMLVTLPCVLLLLDWWPLERLALTPGQRSAAPLRRVLLEKVPFFALSALSCLVTFQAQRASGAVMSLAHNPFELRLANALVAYARYLGKTFWPTDLAVFYPYAGFRLDSWTAVGAGLLLATVTAGLWRARPPRRALQVGWLWFLGMLVPVIGLVQVGKQALADRYTYLPHIGLFLLVVWGAAAVIARRQWPRGIPAAAAALVLGACAVLTARQVAHWRDTATLFQHAARVTPRNFVAYAVIANEFAIKNQPTEAIAWCQKALAISPDYPEAHNTLGNVYASLARYDEAIAHYRAAAEGDRLYADPLNGLGSALVKQGKFAEAEAPCREALRLSPLHLPALYSLATALHGQGKLEEAAACYRRLLALDPKLFTPRRLLGNVLIAQGRPEEAIAELRRALAIQPGDSEARTVLGMLLADRGQADDAAAQFREATRLQATNALAHYQLALLHQGRKETRAAVERLRLALKAQPDWPESLNNLAWILAASADATVRNGAEAVTLAERACQITAYQEPLLIGTLAAAYAEAGRFPEAINAAEKARALAQSAGLTAVAQRNEELLKLYRAGRAYHEPE